MGQGAGLQAGPQRLAEESSHFYTSVYTHTHSHTLTHTPSRTDPPTHSLSCTQLYLQYIRLFFMPCPSQTIEENEEEGDQVNSARQTGCSLQHYWNYFPLWPMEIKANGCDVSAGGQP